MQICDVLTPGVLLSEAYFHQLHQVGTMSRAINAVAEEGFFKRVEIGDLVDSGERREVGATMRKKELVLVQWMSLVLAREQLNLSSCDESLRRHSVDRLRAHLDYADECHAQGFSVLSGPDPGPDHRAHATDQLCRSLCELGESLGHHEVTQLILEPLDRGAHKNALIGPTSEAIDVVNYVRKEGYPIGLSWDSAHVALNGEDVFHSLVTAKNQITQIHFSNAILDRSHSNFGDWHMPIGKAGFLDLQTAGKLLCKALDVKLLGTDRPGVTIEVRTPEGGDPQLIIDRCRSVLEEAYHCATSKCVSNYV